MITLAIDASTTVGSACVARGNDIVASRRVPMRQATSDALLPAIADALREAALDVAAIDRIVCGAGPGSFTGLRIASALAKALALRTGRPLFAVSSLALMVAAPPTPLPPGHYVATLDALRGETYAADCDVGDAGNVVAVGDVTLLAAEEVRRAEAAGRVLVGDGRAVASIPDARGVVRLDAIIDQNGPVHVASWEPTYGRVAEAQRRWEIAQQRPLPNG